MAEKDNVTPIIETESPETDPAPAPEQSKFDRVKGFCGRHKTTILVGTGVAVGMTLLRSLARSGDEDDLSDDEDEAPTTEVLDALEITE